MLSVPHLDREFDYLVSAEQSDDAQPGTRVRVRFHGRLVDAFVLERLSGTDHVGQLGWLDRVISAEPVRERRCRAVVVDRFAVWRHGAHAIWLDPAGARVVSDRAVRGDRPWVPPVPQPRGSGPREPPAPTE